MKKNYRRRLGTQFGLAAVALLAPVFSAPLAHHSISAFDIETEASINGVVIEFEWRNPHTRLRVAAADDPTALVSFEGMSADYLGRRGWQRRSLIAGERLEIVYFPRRDGTAGGQLIRVRTADGTLRVMIDND